VSECILSAVLISLSANPSQESFQFILNIISANVDLLMILSQYLKPKNHGGSTGYLSNLATAVLVEIVEKLGVGVMG